MKAEFVSKEKNDVKFTMVFSAEELEEAVIKVYKDTKDKFPVDGFRKGKAPRSIIEKKFGEDVFLQDALNDLLNTGYPKAVEELDLKVIDSPRLEIESAEKGSDVVMQVTVEVYPDVEVSGYKDVEIEKVVLEATDEDVNKELEMMQQRNARMVSVDRKAEEGDTVLIDYRGTVDGVAFEGGTAENHPLKLGSGSFIPGFEEQLIGSEKGGELDVEVKFPEEYHSEDLAGKDAVFHCKVHEVKEEEIPEIDDEFAQDVSEFDTLEEMKTDMLQKIQEAKDSQAENMMKDAALKAVHEANDWDVPKSMVEDEISAMVREYDGQLRGQGMDMDKYLEFTGKKMEELRADLKEDASKRVKTRMILLAVSEKENIGVEVSEVEKDLETMATQYKMEVEQIKQILGEDNIANLGTEIKLRKTVEFIYDNAVVKEKAE